MPKPKTPSTSSSKSRSADAPRPSDSSKSNPVPIARDSKPSQGTEPRRASERSLPADAGKHPGSSINRSASNPSQPQELSGTSLKANTPSRSSDIDAPSTAPDATNKSGLNLGAVNETELPTDEPL